MNVQATDLFPVRKPVNLAGAILGFPLIRMPICVLFLLIYLLPHNLFIAELIARSGGPGRAFLTLLDAAVSILVLMLLYGLHTRWMEGRKAVEMGLDGAWKEFGTGFLLSLGIVGFMALAMASAGFYRPRELGAPWILPEAFFYFGVGAFVQVVIFRLILFRMTEEVVGTWLAVAVVAVIFGLAHLGNENATPWTSGALVLGDLLLAGAFVYTRRLWMVWGAHAGWNFLQDGVFGLPNSGLSDLPSWVDPVVEGPAWVTGGSFGIEASPLQVVLSLGVALLLFRRARAEGNLVAPAWKRRSPGSRGFSTRPDGEGAWSDAMS